MQAERSIDRTGRLAPLAQAGLAALVAGSLLTFSSLAFNTAFDRPIGTQGIAVSVPRTAPSAPVVLGTRPEPEAPEAPVAQPAPEPVDAADTVVLGTRTERASQERDEKRDKDRTKKEPNTFKWTNHRRSLAGYSWKDSEDSHEHTHGKGHDKARGKGHQKEREDHDEASGGVERGVDGDSEHGPSKAKHPKAKHSKGKKKD